MNELISRIGIGSEQIDEILKLSGELRGDDFNGYFEDFVSSSLEHKLQKVDYLKGKFGLGRSWISQMKYDVREKINKNKILFKETILNQEGFLDLEILKPLAEWIKGNSSKSTRAGEDFK